MRIVVALTALVLACGPAPTNQTRRAAPTKPVPKTQLARAEHFVIDSTHTGRRYRIDVYVPPTSRGETRAVLYLTDGNFLYPLAAALLRLRAIAKLEPVVLVSIGYDTNDIDEAFELRMGDFLPTDRQRVPSKSNEELFLRFISAELRPEVARRYPVDHQRASIAGHSIGGYFVLHVLLREPSLFRGYMVLSPVLKEQTLAAARAFAAQPPRQPIRLFLANGTEEFESQIGEQVSSLVEIFEPLRGSEFEMTRVVFEGEGHLSVAPAALARGLTVLSSAAK